MKMISRSILALGAALAASPALAATGQGFFSLHNTNFVVLLAFILFLGVLAYFKVPTMIGRLLDKRADGIRAELEEARSLREEAQQILASYERKHKEAIAQSEAIVANAKREALAAAEKGKEELRLAIERRLKGAEEQIASAEASAIKEVRNRAISVAVAAAADVLKSRMTETEKSALVEASLAEVEARMQ